MEYARTATLVPELERKISVKENDIAYWVVDGSLGKSSKLQISSKPFQQSVWNGFEALYVERLIMLAAEFENFFLVEQIY